MNVVEQTRHLWEKKSVRKRIAFNAVLLLLAAVIVSAGTLQLQKHIEQNNLSMYAQEIPMFLNRVRDELEMQKAVHERVALARGDMGLKFYLSGIGPEEKDKLEWVKDRCRADSVSLIDEDGTILASTGIEIPASQLEMALGKLKARDPLFTVYPDTNGNEEGDGCILVKIPFVGEGRKSLLYEFACDSLIKVYGQITAWPETVFKQFHLEENVLIFAVENQSRLCCYPVNKLESSESEQLLSELTAALEKGKITEEISFLRLLGKSYMAFGRTDPDGNLGLVLALPIGNFILSSITFALILFGMLAVNLVVFQIYARRCMQHESGRKDTASFIRLVRGRTQPGLLVMLLFIVCFMGLFLQLGNRTILSRYTMNRRIVLQQEMSWREKQKTEICQVYKELYLARTEVTAGLLTDPAYRTKEGLKELATLCGADYLMLFNSKGQEVLSSNSYTGFSVSGENANVDEEYQAMVLGYPSVVVGPREDPYSGKLQIGAAILLTKEDGQSDGFLMGVFDTGELEAVLDSESCQSAVTSFILTGKEVIAVVTNEDGRFIAHTNPELIGQKAADYLDEEVLSKGFEGFANYKGKPMCISSSREGGLNTIMIFPESFGEGMVSASVWMTFFMLLLCFFEYLFIYRLCGEPKKGGREESGSYESVTVFFQSYAFYFTVLAASDLALYVKGVRNYFSFIFRGNWSRGLHLFALWAVIFILSATVSLLKIVKATLNRVSIYFSFQGQTLIKMFDNVFFYLTGLFLIFGTLYIFGVSAVMLAAALSSVAVAFGFGARNVTGDFLNGILIIVENTIHVGDEIKYGDRVWTVTNITLRSTELTDEEQNVMRLSNTEINRSVNLTRKKKR